jgi:hypothetical protein
MIVISGLFAILHLITSPLVLGAWVVLLFRFGVLGSLFRQTKILVDHQKEPAARNRTWLILTIGVFSIFIILFFCLDVLLIQRSGDLELSVLGERSSIVITVVLTFPYSPVWLVLTLEAWLILAGYFGLHYLLYRLEVPVDRGQHIKSFAVTMLQLVGILTALIGFGWWSYVGITDQSRFESIDNFSIVVLSPTTVLLTVGLVIMLFISLSKITAIEENTEQHEQVAGRITIALLSTLILFGTVGSILSILIHYDRSVW